MKKLIAILFVTAFVACDIPEDSENIPTSKIEILTSLEETEKDSSTAEAKKDSLPNANNARTAAQPLLIGRGAEPGWYAEFYADHVKLELDYGKVKEEVKYDFSRINESKTYDAKISGSSQQGEQKKAWELAVKIEAKSCTEASGETREQSITLIFNGNTYTGCASAAK